MARLTKKQGGKTPSCRPFIRACLYKAHFSGWMDLQYFSRNSYPIFGSENIFQTGRVLTAGPIRLFFYDSRGQGDSPRASPPSHDFRPRALITRQRKKLFFILRALRTLDTRVHYYKFLVRVRVGVGARSILIPPQPPPEISVTTVPGGDIAP
jgi:hypothetical protein